MIGGATTLKALTLPRASVKINVPTTSRTVQGVRLSPLLDNSVVLKSIELYNKGLQKIRVVSEGVQITPRRRPRKIVPYSSAVVQPALDRSHHFHELRMRHVEEGPRNGRGVQLAKGPAVDVEVDRSARLRVIAPIDIVGPRDVGDVIFRDR